MCLMQTAHRCRVRGYLAQGARPHINLFQVRYTSDVLAASSALLGKELRIYYNSDDLRIVRAFLADGSDLGYSRRREPEGDPPRPEATPRDHESARQETTDLHGHAGIHRPLRRGQAEKGAVSRTNCDTGLMNRIGLQL